MKPLWLGFLAFSRFEPPVSFWWFGIVFDAFVRICTSPCKNIQNSCRSFGPFCASLFFPSSRFYPSSPPFFVLLAYLLASWSVWAQRLGTRTLHGRGRAAGVARRQLRMQYLSFFGDWILLGTLIFGCSDCIELWTIWGPHFRSFLDAETWNSIILGARV